MHKLDEKGSLLIPLVAVIVVLCGAIGFGGWAFVGRQDYKDNVDAKIDEAVEASNEKLSLEKEAEFADREKAPYKTYQGPSAQGTLNITYPKTWSAYVDAQAKSSLELNGYLHPDFVSSIDGDSSFALRFQVVNQTYDQVMKTFESKVKSGKVTVSAYRAPKVQEGLGAQITGEVEPKKDGVMVVLPTRDKTIKVWTEGGEFRGDFKTLLESFTYIP